MYQCLFILDDTDHQDTVALAHISRLGCQWVSEAHGFKHIEGKTAYIGIFPNSMIFKVVFAAMTPRTPAIIGIWNMDGSQQGRPRRHVSPPPVTVSEEVAGIIISPPVDTTEHVEEMLAKFNKQLYTDMLADDVVYDSNGEIISSTPAPPDRQIQSIAGWGERDLTDYG